MAHRTALLPLLALALQLLDSAHGGESPRPAANVLFIVVDDLKPLLGCYGASWIHSPNIDRLAARGTLFTASYCQVSFCAPSRTSVLTGLRPDTTRLVFNPPQQHDLLRTRFPDLVTLPQHFKNHGWRTCAMGKVFDGRTVDEAHDAASWSMPYVRRFEEAPGGLGTRGFQNRATKQYLADALAASPNAVVMGPPTEGEDVPDHAYYDGAMALTAADKIREFAGQAQPFFLAVGFVRPHLPFVAPTRYWDLYDRAALPLPRFQQLPRGSPHDLAFYSNSGELRAWQGVPKTGPIEEALQRELVHGYAACVSYIDAQVGRLIRTLEQSGVTDETIVCLWGDHGWHLGEQGHWGKVTNYEHATRAPLIISAPGHKLLSRRVATLVEFVDIYPTLCDLAGIPRPAHLQGVSLAPAMTDGSIAPHAAAISQMSPGAGRDSVMGWALRTPRYRYIEWRRVDVGLDWMHVSGQVESIELYDYQTDPFERDNIAGEIGAATVLREQQALFDRLLPNLPPRRPAPLARERP